MKRLARTLPQGKQQKNKNKLYIRMISSWSIPHTQKVFSEILCCRTSPLPEITISSVDIVSKHHMNQLRASAFVLFPLFSFVSWKRRKLGGGRWALALAFACDI
jgi:hypothetical protein